MTIQRTALSAMVIIPALMIIATAFAQAQHRVVVLPFRNMDGHIDYNIWQYELSDSLRTVLLSMDPEEKYYHIVDPDSVEMAISEYNLDPTNIQYESDVWRAVESLNAKYVVQGNFFLQGERVLMNCYVYNVEFKISDNKNRAKNIFKKPDTYLSAVVKMAKKVYPGLTKDE